MEQPKHFEMSDPALNVIIDDNQSIPIDDDTKENEHEASTSNPSQPKILKKGTSLVWSYFTKVSNKEARCIICNGIFKRADNTSNMRSHLMRKHSLIWNSSNSKHNLIKRQTSEATSSDNDSHDDPQASGPVNSRFKRKLSTIDEAFSRIKSFRDGGKNADQLTNVILYMISVDKNPLSIVEKKGFVHLMKFLVPLYNIPSRKTITRLLEHRYLTLKKKFISRVEHSISYCLTCDNWTDVTNQSYLGVTIHQLKPDLTVSNANIGVFPLDKNHTADYLADSLNTVIEEFQLKRSKIMCIISDNAANIKAAITKSVGSEKHVGCFAHILSHLVPDVLDDMNELQKIIQKVRTITSTVKRSIPAFDELKRLQVQDGKTEGTCVKFKMDMKVRWNSSLYMILRFLELEQYVYLVVRKCANKPAMVESEEIYILNDVVLLMKIIEQGITEISGETYPTASMVIPIVNCMKIQINAIKPKSEHGVTFKEKLMMAIDRRCNNLETNKILAIATMLDPRFKKIHFQKALTAANTIATIENIIVKNSDLPKKVVESQKIISKDSLWSCHDELIALASGDGISQRDYSEMREYLKQPCLERKGNPFEFWKSSQNRFPKLYEVAIRYISILGTSVPSERLFSQAGNIITDDRSRLTGEHVNILLFLSSLSQQDWGLD